MAGNLFIINFSVFHGDFFVRASSPLAENYINFYKQITLVGGSAGEDADDE